jgi:hypothetical protein
MHSNVSSDPLRLSSCNTLYFFLFQESVAGWCDCDQSVEVCGGVSVLRPLGCPHKVSDFFFHFQKPVGGWCDFDQSVEVCGEGSQCRDPLGALTRPAVCSYFFDHPIALACTI